MANYYPSLSMNLPIPVVGVDPGPDWALNINASLTIIDAHDHSAGKGVQITPNGLDINSTLTINNNDVINFRTVRFTPQISVAGAADLGCLYVSGVDLYYNDENGNQIQITQFGNVAGTPGSIANLTSPASASYVSGNQTFVWQSAVNTAANMDFQSAILRNSTSSSYGLTLSAPNLMSTDFSITLPFLPVTQSIMTIDSSGNIGTPAVYPITSAGIASATIANSNLAVMPDQTIKGNVSGSSAVPSDLTASQVRTMIAAKPTVTRYTTAGQTGTYVPPANCQYIRVSMVGGGGGQSGNGTSSYFNPIVAGNAAYSAGAGTWGTATNNNGTPTIINGNKAGLIEVSISGNVGYRLSPTGYGIGGGTFFGSGSWVSGDANTGIGAGNISSGVFGGGGGAYLQILFTDLASAYDFRVGIGGSGGGGNTGGSGVIIIEEFYI